MKSLLHKLEDQQVRRAILLGILCLASLLRGDSVPLYLTLACFTFSILVFYPQECFRIQAINPYLLIFASYALAKIITRENLLAKAAGK